jgi:hypothetical protein
MTLKNNIWDIENSFYLQSSLSRIGKLISQYEIYKKIIHLPGDIVELGVFKGVSAVRLLSFRNILENNFSRKFYGFDTFSKFPKQKKNYDKLFVKKWELQAGHPWSNKKIQFFLKKKFKNFRLIKGNILNTIPTFLKTNNCKIALLHLDLDVYEATKFAINNFFPKVVKGGIIMVDDYNSEVGATNAINEFITKKKIIIKRLKFNAKPYFFKKN